MNMVLILKPVKLVILRECCCSLFYKTEKTTIIFHEKLPEKR